jgi:hypothetical protein
MSGRVTIFKVVLASHFLKVVGDVFDGEQNARLITLVAELR